MKVKIDDGRDWVFMRDDGKVYDSKGKEIRWVPIDDLLDPKEFRWKPIEELGEDEDEIAWREIGNEPMLEGKGGKQKPMDAKPKTLEKRSGNGKA